MSMYGSLLLCCWKRVFAMSSAFPWQNLISLCPTSFCTLWLNLPFTPDISSLHYLAFQSPMMIKASLLAVSSKSSVFIELFNFSFFIITGRGIDLDYCDIEWFALETEIILSFLRSHPSTAFRTLMLTMMATPFLLRDSCP